MQHGKNVVFKVILHELHALTQLPNTPINVMLPQIGL